MTSQPTSPDPFRDERRRILRRARMYTYGFVVAAIVVAALGSAVIAWLLSSTGLPFLETWITLALLVLLAPLVGVGVRALRRRRPGSGA